MPDDIRFTQFCSHFLSVIFRVFWQSIRQSFFSDRRSNPDPSVKSGSAIQSEKDLWSISTIWSFAILLSYFEQFVLDVCAYYRIYILNLVKAAEHDTLWCKVLSNSFYYYRKIFSGIKIKICKRKSDQFYILVQYFCHIVIYDHIRCGQIGPHDKKIASEVLQQLQLH